MTAMPGPMARQLCRAVPLFILAIGVLCDAVAQTPPAPVVTLASDVRQIRFSWPIVLGDGPNDATPGTGAVYLY